MKRKGLKIAYLIPGMYNSGGMERILSTMANYLVDQWNAEVHIITTEQKGRPYFFPVSVKVKTLDLDINFYEKEKEGYLEKWYSRNRKKIVYKQRLEHALQEIKPDITVTLFGLEIDFINSLTDGSIKVGNMQFFKDFRSRYLSTHTRNPLLRMEAKMRNRQMVNQAGKLAALIVLTEKDLHDWQEVKNARTIPNPLPFTFEGEARLTNKQVISVGRLSFEKGFDLLIDAWKIIAEKKPDWTLNIYGKGNMEAELRARIQSLSLENSVLIHAPVQDIWNKYAESSIYVLPSRYEGLPTVLLEAMYCGLPSVAFRSMNDPEDILADGETGLLVEKENVSQLAQKTEMLMESYPERLKMGSGARQNTEKYQVHTVMRQWIGLFEDLIQKKDINK